MMAYTKRPERAALCRCGRRDRIEDGDMCVKCGKLLSRPPDPPQGFLTAPAPARPGGHRRDRHSGRRA